MWEREVVGVTAYLARSEDHQVDAHITHTKVILIPVL